MEVKDGVKTFHAPAKQDWRKWLETHHQTEKSVWLIIYKKESGVPSVYYPEAVDEALCFGWIDSKANKRDAQSYYQYFAKRKPGSNWSKVNKDKVEGLQAEGLMAAAGLEMIEIAKQNGSWTALDEVEKLSVPDDLKQAFEQNQAAFAFWENFPPSSKRAILEWIQNAKRPETRHKRIEETVRLAGQNIRANHYRQ
ncbi:YdeI/OmpD-associated family protein [Catalinimonas sp. 4WD22]|uniref:YdeI/OmpD-associated family protein n=1 Tax=Catalinimonas locisalis TaxID=3133978 RepID=UPI0031016602